MVESNTGSATMRVTQIEEVRLRSDNWLEAGMWSRVSPEQRVPLDHPLPLVRAIVETILADLSLAKPYFPVGRPSIPLEKLWRTLLLQVPRSTCGERLLMEQPAALALVRRGEHG
jgi:hypothetical protein